MLRTIGGIIAGIAIGLAAIMAVQFVGQQIYPTGNVDLRDREAMAALIASLPARALMFVVLAWFLGAFVGGAVAARISGHRWAAWAIGGLIALTGVANVLMYPHPLWMQIAAVVAPLLGAVIAGHMFGAKVPGRREQAA